MTGSDLTHYFRFAIIKACGHNKCKRNKNDEFSRQLALTLLLIILANLMGDQSIEIVNRGKMVSF